MIRPGVFATVGVALLVLTAQPVSAEVVLLDSFEDGDVSEYTLTDPGDTTVQTNLVREGAYALNLSSVNLDAAQAVSTSGLDEYPDPGESWTTYVHWTQTTVQSEIFWAAQGTGSTPDGYEIQIVSNGAVDLKRVESGTDTTLDSLGNADLGTNEWVNVTVRWGAGGEIAISVHNESGLVGWLNASDGTYTDGGIGYRAIDNNPTTGSNVTFDTPTIGALEIREVVAPNALIAPDQVNVTLYQGTDILDRQTTSGVVSLEDLQPGQPFVAQAESGDYIARRSAFVSPEDNRTMYLLNKSATTISPTFVLRDFTGRYPPEDTQLFVQRSIDGNWTTVSGDYFGSVNQVGTTLEANRRYRLVVHNGQTGNRRVLGPVTLSTSTTVELTVRTGEIQITGLGPAVRYTPETRALEATATPALTVRVEQRDRPLEEWNISVSYTAPDGTTQQLTSTDGTNPLGTTYDPTIDLQNRAGGTVTVDVRWVVDGVTGQTSANFSVVRAAGNANALIPTLATVSTRLPARHVGAFQSAVSILVTVVAVGVVADRTLFSTEALGAVGVVLLTGFAVLAWLPYSVLFAATISFLALAGLRRVA